MAYKKFQELAIYQAIENLAEWLVPHVGRYPRWLRPTLGQETMTCLLNVLRSTTTAYGAPQARKLPYLEKASLVLNPKTRIVTAKAGVPFLGYRVWADHRRVLRPNVVAGRRKLRVHTKMVGRGRMNGYRAVESLRSWFAHLAHADTYGLRKSLWREVKITLGEYL